MPMVMPETTVLPPMYCSGIAEIDDTLTSMDGVSFSFPIMLTPEGNASPARRYVNFDIGMFTGDNPIADENALGADFVTKDYDLLTDEEKTIKRRAKDFITFWNPTKQPTIRPDFGSTEPGTAKQGLIPKLMGKAKFSKLVATLAEYETSGQLAPESVVQAVKHFFGQIPVYYTLRQGSKRQHDGTYELTEFYNCQGIYEKVPFNLKWIAKQIAELRADGETVRVAWEEAA